MDYLLDFIRNTWMALPKRITGQGVCAYLYISEQNSIQFLYEIESKDDSLKCYFFIFISWFFYKPVLRKFYIKYVRWQKEIALGSKEEMLIFHP